MQIGLYKQGRLIDFGVVSKIPQYQKMGYEIRVLVKKKPTYRHALNEFTELWLTLDKRQKMWFKHLLTNKMSIYTRLEMLKEGVIRMPSTVSKPKRKSLFNNIFSAIKERRWCL